MRPLWTAAILAMLMAPALAQDGSFEIVSKAPSEALIAREDAFFSFYPPDLCRKAASGDDAFSYACALDARNDTFLFQIDASRKRLILQDVSIADDLDYNQSVQMLRELFQ